MNEVMGVAFKGRSASVQDRMVQDMIQKHRWNVVQYVLLSKHNTVMRQVQITCRNLT